MDSTTKSFLTSKTVIGVVTLMVSSLFKVHLDNALVADVINNALTISSAALAIYGRFAAVKKLTVA